MIRDIVERHNLKLVGVVDINPSLIGKGVFVNLLLIVFTVLDVGVVCNLGKELGVRVSLPEAIARIDADVCVITTVSALTKLWPILKQCLKAGKNVVSTW